MLTYLLCVGSSRGGIRGVFRDSKGKVLLQFCKEVILLALQEGIVVASVSRWVLSYSFLFESDSQSIVFESGILCRFLGISTMFFVNAILCLELKLGG